MSTAPLQSRLKELSAALGQVHPLIDRLRNFTASIGQGDEARLELGSEIHDRLKEAEEDMELLRDEVEALESGSDNRRKTVDDDKEAEKERVISLAGRLDGDLKRLVFLSLLWRLYSNGYVIIELGRISETLSYKRKRMRRLRNGKREIFCFRDRKLRTRSGQRRS